MEGEQGYFRRNHMVPRPEARDLEHLNELLRGGSKEEEQRVIAGRTQTIGAAMAIEREYLRPLAEEEFDLAAVSFPVVNQSRTVNVLTNFYSAPLPPGTKVEAKAYAAYIELWYEGRCIARHERCFSRQQKVLNLEHYLDVLAKKPGAFSGSAPLEQWRAQGRWQESFDRFWEQLQQRCGRQDGTRAMIDILLLGRQHGYEPMRRAVEQALQVGGSDVALIRYLIEMEQGESRVPTAALEVGWLRRYERPQPTLQDYDQLLDRRNPRGDPMSEAKTALELASIKQFCSRLHPPTIASQCARLSEQAVKERQSHLCYLDALLEAEVDERERNAAQPKAIVFGHADRALATHAFNPVDNS